ncbi:MAG: glycosyltransferase family 2 protein [Candidatus Binatia bacterium]
MPRISVIIPTFNNASLLAETLDSVFAQSCTDFELIVVDDGSTDGTGMMIKHSYPRVKYVYQPNRGPAAARNVGVGLAEGEYIAFCDHDDLWEPGHLRALLDGFAAHPDAAMVFDNAEYFGVGVEQPKLHLDDVAGVSLSQGAVSAKTLLWDYPVASMSVVMVRRESFALVGGLNERVGALDDLHFYLRIAAHHEVRFVDCLGCRKRVTGQTLSQSINIKETNVDYLEELWRIHPEVVQSIGLMSFRLRLARKYFKLGRYCECHGERSRSKEMFWKAYRTNYLNPRYLWHTLLG